MQKLKGAETKLEKAVQEIVNHHADGYGLKEWLEDLLRNGCQSGMVSELIYYRDTLEFFETHKQEISGLLVEVGRDCGVDASEIFASWDHEDPLALDTQNQNLLAWFAFEETARRLADRNGIEV